MELPGVRVHNRIVRVLVATAVAAEQAACENAAADVRAVGVGPAAAAAGTAALLAHHDYDVVICAGIAGGLNGTEVGQVVVADQIVFAGLGAETPDGFRPLSALGFGDERYPVDAELARQLARRTEGVLGTVLTVTTVTGTEDTLATSSRRSSGGHGGSWRCRCGRAVRGALRRTAVDQQRRRATRPDQLADR